MPGSILLTTSYVLLAIFVVVFIARTVRIAKLPVHLRWELAPVPHEKGKGEYGGSYFEEYEWWTQSRQKSLTQELVYMFQEIVFIKSVWMHNRRLWWLSFPFHFGMYLLIAAGVLLAFGTALEVLALPGADWDGLRVGILGLAGAGYVLGGVGAIGLLLSRSTDRRMKAFATPATFFNLAILLAVFISGAFAMIAVDDFVVRLSTFTKALVTFDLATDTPVALATHLIVAFVFLAYLPFSQMMHFVAKYFTYHQVRWDDEPMLCGSRMEKEVLELLSQPVTWSGRHLKADGRKNWVDIATEDPAK